MRIESRTWASTHGALLAANVLLGSLGPALKGVYFHFSPWSTAMLRIMGAGAAALLIVWGGKMVLPPRSIWKRLFGLSLLGVSLNQLTYLIGLSMTNSVTGTILLTTIPVFTYAVAVGVGDERIALWRVAGIGVACAGALFLVVSRSGRIEGVSVLGSSLIVLSCFFTAAYLVLVKRCVKEYSASAVLVMVLIFGALTIIPLTLPFVKLAQWGEVSWKGWTGMAYIILGPTLIAYFLNVRVMERGTTSSFIALYIYLQPLVAALIAVPLLGERISGVMVASAALIMLGIFLVTRTERAPLIA